MGSSRAGGLHRRCYEVALLNDWPAGSLIKAPSISQIMHKLMKQSVLVCKVIHWTTLVRTRLGEGNFIVVDLDLDNHVQFEPKSYCPQLHPHCSRFCQSKNTASILHGGVFFSLNFLITRYVAHHCISSHV